MRRDNTDHLKQLAAQWPGRVVPVKLEATDDESVANAAKVVEEKLQGKGLDYLINNAGVSSYCPDGLGGV
jgi:NADP-dependent 3-hydroxy acid dehydrogenase YdfG